MAQESKKISFGFSKSIKKPDLKPVTQIETKKVDYIEYVDDKSIKVIGKEEKKDEPLVIPMLGSKSWHDRIINKINADIYGPSKGDAQKNGNTTPTDAIRKLTNSDNKDNATDSTTTVDTVKQEPPESDKSTVSLEELAAREIIKDLKGEDDEEKPSVDITIEQSNNLEGEKEPTLENYEEIPIDQFGLALLRGMGWEPEKGIGKNSKVVPVTLPNLRPRGMGLGADKVMIQKQNVKPKTKEEQELKLEKGCYVRITAGKYNNSYGILEGFDDESGRLIVKLALGNKCVSLNEYLIEPVTKENYAKNSKVLNISTYERFNNSSGGGQNRTQSSSVTEANSKEENGHIQNKVLKNEIVPKHRAKSVSSDASSDTDGKRKRKYESNDKNHHHKMKKSKKRRCHDDLELSRKNTKKDKDREKTRDRSKSHHSSKSTDKKKSKRHKRSRSRSPVRR